jgi:hypothetical protein
MLKKLRIVGIIVTASLLMNGCVTVKKSRIPEFLQELNNHEFNQYQKQTIGKILDYVNTLENQ